MEIIEMVERDIDGSYRYIFLKSQNTTDLTPKVPQSYQDEYTGDLGVYKKNGGNNRKKRLLKKYI